MSKDQVIYMLNRLPTTEIVKCDDCKYKYIKDMSAYCPNRVGALRSDGYCERGERK